MNRVLATIVGAGFLVTGAYSARAALAPQYDRLAQFRAVLESGVVDVLGNRPIDKIERGEDGGFRVWSGPCVVMVRLDAQRPKQGMVGPTTYKIAKISPLACQ
jgi:hypothetical protein